MQSKSDAKVANLLAISGSLFERLVKYRIFPTTGHVQVMLLWP